MELEEAERLALSLRQLEKFSSLQHSYGPTLPCFLQWCTFHLLLRMGGELRADVCWSQR